MSCPDWRELVAQRDAAPARELPAWAAARHHATQCERCREEALAAEPLLLFARLPERRVTPDEIGDMQSAVAALVRAGRVGRDLSGPAEASDPFDPSAPSDPSDYRTGRSRSRGSRSWRRLSFARVAAALGVCSLLALSGAPRPRSPQVEPLLAAQGGSVEEVQPLGSVVEELDRPGARIYELPQSGMAVVMIVDASLDV